MSIDGRLASRINMQDSFHHNNIGRSKLVGVNQALEPSRPQGRHVRKRSDHDVFNNRPSNEGLIKNNNLSSESDSPKRVSTPRDNTRTQLEEINNINTALLDQQK